MKKIVLACVCAGAMLFGVAQASGKPFYGTWGFDLSNMDKSVKPGDDFFRYANGHWVATHQIPADKATTSLRYDMSDRIEARLHDMMETGAKNVAHQPSDLAGKVAAFYKAFMDEQRIDSLGAKPISPELNTIRAAKTREQLAALMGKTNTDFYNTLFNIGIDIDLKKPSHYAVLTSQGGLGLPDRDYYLQPNFVKQKVAYQAHVAQVLHLLKWPDAQARAKDILDYETKIAQASWTKAQERDPVATYNPMTFGDLAKAAPGFDWKGFFTAANLGRVPRVIVIDKSAFPKLAVIYVATPVQTLQAWMAFHVADNASPYLAKPFADVWFEMNEKTLSGQEQQRVRWKRAIDAVSGIDFGAGGGFGTFGTMGFGVGQIYTAKYFGSDSKAKIEDLVHNLLTAYHARIEKLDWMSPATKAEALKKLDTYTIKVGYPDHPRDYSKLVITEDDIVSDVRNAAANDWAFYVDRFNGPVDKSDWLMTPQTNDAYNGSLRDIVFPAGILQPPIFDPNADAAVNYGAIGAVIGHELTHGFDDQGRQIDASGALRNWWTKDDASKFKARAAMLGSQYSSYEPVPGAHINGDLTMGENIADLGGLTLALDAYHASLNGQPAPVLDGLTGDQRVFLGWAQAWCGKARDDVVRKALVSDPHSPRKFRVDGVTRNIDAWYVAFDVKPGDKFYVVPRDRVHIW